MSFHSSFRRILILPDQNLDSRRSLTLMAPSTPPERQSLKPEDPLAECDSGKNLRSERFGDIYASTHDPIGESEQFFSMEINFRSAGERFLRNLVISILENWVLAPA